MPPTNETFAEKLIVPVVSAVIILLILVLYAGLMRSVKTDTIDVPIAVKKADPFENIKLSAKSAIVWDIKNQRTIFEYNADIPRPLASLTKVMMAVTAADLVPWYTTVPIKEEFLAEEGDSGLLADEEWRLKDLIDFSLVTSSNDGARAIASAVGAVEGGVVDYDIGRKEFIKKMNEKAKEIGLSSVHFENENGLDADAVSGGAYGSARDVVRLFEYTLENYPDIVDATKHGSVERTSLSNVAHTGHNTNFAVESIPGVLASKTGFTTLAGGNLAIAFDPQIGRPIIISVLGSTAEGRFSDVTSLIDASRMYLKQE